VEYLLGLVFWYTGKKHGWRTALMSAQLAVLALYSASVALWMWHTISGTDLRAGEIMEGGEREDWADAERFQSAETGSASFGI
jgi:hypothetical protein